MNYNASSFEIARPNEGLMADVGTLYAELATLTDRRDPRGKRYELALIPGLIVLAKLSGEDHPYGVAQWVQERNAYLIAVLGVRRLRLPSLNTYRRALGENVQVEELQRLTHRALTRREGVGASALISLDGKTLRGTILVGEARGVHLLAAYLPQEGVVLMQVAVEGKENEVSTAPKVLNSLDLDGKIVIGDALLTQRGLSIQIVAAGGDDVWVVKDNHPQLRQDIEQVFQTVVCSPGFSPVPDDVQTAHQVNKGHGRIEEQTITTSRLLKD